MSAPLVELRGITKIYRTGEVEVPVLAGIDLTIGAGDYMALMGRSGSGKSTLMHILGLLDQPTAGSYRFEGRETAHLGDDERSRLRGQTIGFVFQRFHLIPSLDILANVELPMRYQRAPKAAWAPRATDLLVRVGLGHRLHHRPNQLSGGEQQRVAIARSLVNRPRILLADEPTGNLDTAAHASVMALFSELRAELGLTVILVTHDPAVGRAAERCVEVFEGRCRPRVEAAHA
ncbi:Lipoprotein releasing system ATP-binding protein LolD [Minicystis rosea]|nr:Lipoprotein releasing system ATP-binding protein LolD [Minicystis rosea]